MTARATDEGGSSSLRKRPIPESDVTVLPKRVRVRVGTILKRGAADLEIQHQEEEQVQPPAANIQLSATSESALYDSDLLDCPICISPLSTPVFQCENGHVVCKRCSIRIGKKCPSCSCPTGQIRCRWAERFLESLKVSCQYAEHGCKVKLSYHVKLSHESTCIYAPCSCPHDDCNYIGMSEKLYTHFSERHPDSSKLILLNTTIFVSLDKNRYVFLRGAGSRTLFVLQNSVEPLGNLVNIVCIEPASSKNKFSYELSATVAENTVSFRGNVEPTPELTMQSPMGKYLIVPEYFANSNGRTELKVIIRTEFI